MSDQQNKDGPGTTADVLREAVLAAARIISGSSGEDAYEEAVKEAREQADARAMGLGDLAASFTLAVIVLSKSVAAHEAFMRSKR